jgi:hypothetical protein
LQRRWIGINRKIKSVGEFLESVNNALVVIPGSNERHIGSCRQNCAS